MNRNLTAVAIMSLLLIGMVAPLFVPGDDAVTDDDYYIVLSGTSAPDEVVKSTIANGKSHTWALSVINVSDGYLSVTYSYHSDSEDIKLSSTPGPVLLGYEGSDRSNVDTNDITIVVEKLSDAYSALNFTITVSVMDMEKNFTTKDIVFDLEITSVYDGSGHFNKFFGIIPNTLSEPLNNPWFTAIVSVIVFTIVVGLIGAQLVTYAVGVITKSKKKEESRFGKGIIYLMLPLALIISINMAAQILDLRSSIISLISDVSMILVTVLALIILWRVYMFIIKATLGNAERVRGNSSFDTSLVPLFKMIGRIIFWVSGVSIVLGLFGVDLQGILVSAGVVSLGITLGAQNVLSQFFSGIVLLTTRPFRPGDYLKINDKVYIVRKVKLMYTEFNNWAGDELITMPNNVVSSASISNMTKGDKICRQYVFFSVAYGTDLKKAAEVMKAAARKSPLVIEDAKHEGPAVRVTNFLSSGIELRLAIHTPTFDDTSAAAGEVRGLVYEAFAENGIEIPYDRIQIDVLSDRTKKAE